HIRPAEIPWKAASGMTYDSGDFPAVFERAVKAAHGFEARREESRKRGRLRGLGIGSYLEVTAPPNKEMGGLRFEGDKQITLVTGTLDYGQGHAAGFAQTVASRLGVPFERVRLVQGDSDELVFGAGTGGSRSMMMSGAAIVEVSKLVIEKGKQLAAEALEAAAADIEFLGGRYVVGGTDRSIGLLELAKRYPGKLDTTHVTEVIPSAFPNGCHVCEVEIDPETGKVEIVRYSSVNDFGTVVNPLTVEGQVHDGVVQGIGQCLMENARYDEEGQLLTGSFMDYALPRAVDIQTSIEWASHPVPATTNPLDRKSTRLNSSHRTISYAVFCLKKKTNFRAMRGSRLRHRLRDRAHAADCVAPRAFLAVHLAEAMMQEHIRRARRVGARVIPDHA